MRFLARTIALSLLVPAAGAQAGAVLRGPFDIQQLTGNSRLIGIEFGPGAVPANPGTLAGEYLWVTGTRYVPGSPHQLYQIDVAAGIPTLVAIYPTPAAVDPSNEGLHDLAYDDTTNLLYGGTETSISTKLFAFDCVNLRWDPAQEVTVQGSSLACLRALACDPKSRLFYAADLVGAFEEIDAGTGVVRRSYQQHGAGPVSGLAFTRYADGGRLLDSFAQGGTTAPAGYPGSQVVIRRHALTLSGTSWGCETGLMTFADQSLAPAPGQPAGGVSGGLAKSVDASGRHVLWCLQQAQSDAAVAIDFTWGVGQACAGSSGLEPIAGFVGDAPYLGNTNWEPFCLSIQGANTGYLFLGTSTQAWNGQPLPISLGFAGVPGCSIWVSWDVPLGAAPVTGAGGNGCSLVVPIPNVAALAGATVYGQWAIQDPGAPGSHTTSKGFGFVIK